MCWRCALPGWRLRDPSSSIQTILAGVTKTETRPMEPSKAGFNPDDTAKLDPPTARGGEPEGSAHQAREGEVREPKDSRLRREAFAAEERIHLLLREDARFEFSLAWSSLLLPVLSPATKYVVSFFTPSCTVAPRAMSSRWTSSSCERAPRSRKKETPTSRSARRGFEARLGRAHAEALELCVRRRRARWDRPETARRSPPSSVQSPGWHPRGRVRQPPEGRGAPPAFPSLPRAAWLQPALSAGFQGRKGDAPAGGLSILDLFDDVFGALVGHARESGHGVDRERVQCPPRLSRGRSPRAARTRTTPR